MILRTIRRKIEEWSRGWARNSRSSLIMKILLSRSKIEINLENRMSWVIPIFEFFRVANWFSWNTFCIQKHCPYTCGCTVDTVFTKVQLVTGFILVLRIVRFFVLEVFDHQQYEIPFVNSRGWASHITLADSRIISFTDSDR